MQKFHLSETPFSWLLEHTSLLFLKAGQLHHHTLFVLNYMIPPFHLSQCLFFSTSSFFYFLYQNEAVWEVEKPSTKEDTAEQTGSFIELVTCGGSSFPPSASTGIRVQIPEGGELGGGQQGLQARAVSLGDIRSSL